MRALLSSFKKHWGKVIFTVFVVVFSIAATNWLMIRATDERVFTEVKDLPQNDVGLVLGTSPRLKNGALNWHFKVRIDAAVLLFQSGKIHHLLLSGDNHSKDYDEPTEMKNALLQRGIPEPAMTLDCAGFRTLDSVVRAKKVFGQEKVTIITEDFHAHRSVFLAEQSGVDAVVFCGRSLDGNWSLRAKIRETGARAKAALDVFVFHRQPKFLGEKVAIKV